MSPHAMPAVLALTALLGINLARGVAAPSPPDFDRRDDAGVPSGAPSMSPETIPPPPAPPPPPEMPSTEALTGANPLWGIPLSTLTATRERPIFLPSRRAPKQAVPAAPAGRPQAAAVAAAEADKPDLNLVGTIAGAKQGFAVFINTATRDIVRLRTGEGHEGWILTSVKGREAILEKNRKSAVIALPPLNGEQK